MPPAIKVTLHYDILSTFSYFGFVLLRRYRDIWNMDLQFKPVSITGVILGSGNTPPANLPPKDKYLRADFKRLEKFYQIEAKSPPGHPMQMNTVNIMRFLRVVADDAPELLEEVTRRLYFEFYTHNTPITTLEFYRSITPSLFSKEKFKSLMRASQTPENKARLKTETESVVRDLGAFGLPWILIERADGEKACFFGSDRMEAIANWLGDEYTYSGSCPALGASSRL